MRTRTAFLLVAALLAVSPLICNLQASLVNLPTVTVGDPGNVADTTGYGAVSYRFNIGKYEVTISQYTTFLNSVASVTSDSYIVDLWNPNMETQLNIAGIGRNGSGTLASPYSYSVIGSGNRPIAYVSWFDAARFANWINNGATNGASTETGAYTLNGATTGIITKNAGATWWIPSEDEWYKAAYNKGGGTNTGYWVYPTQSYVIPDNNIGGETNQANIELNGYAITQTAVYDPNQNYLTDAGAFINSASAYGTFDQGGSVWEWNDAVIGSARGLRGGGWGNNDFQGNYFGPAGGLQSYLRNSDGFPTSEYNNVGFRIASLGGETVPEPGTWAAAALLAAGAAFVRWRRTRE